MLDTQTYYDLDDDVEFSKFKNDFIKLTQSGQSINARLFMSRIDRRVVNKIIALKKRYPLSKVNIEYLGVDFKQDIIDDPAQIESIKKFALYCEDNGFELHIKLGTEYMGNESSVKNFLVSKKVVDDFATKLNAFTLEGEPLSPAEKLFVVYNFVANRIYNQSDWEDNDMRSWMGALSTDKIVCSGYAALLSYVCKVVFKEDEVACFPQGLALTRKRKGEVEHHQNNMIFIRDDKYGLNAFYYADSCWDAKTKSEEPTFLYFLMPYQKIIHLRDHEFEFKGLNAVAHASGAKVTSSNWQTEIDDFIVKNGNLQSLEHMEKVLGRQLADSLDLQQKEFYRENETKISDLKNNFQNFINSIENKDVLKILKNDKIYGSFSYEFYSKYPIIKEMKKYISNFDMNNGVDEELILRYGKFAQEHKEELCQNAVFFDSMENMLLLSNLTNAGLTFEYYEKFSEGNAKILEAYNNQFVKYFETRQSLIKPKQLPDDLLKRGLRAVALFNGQSEKEASEYVNDQLGLRKTFLEEYFENETEDEVERD